MSQSFTPGPPKFDSVASTLARIRDKTVTVLYSCAQCGIVKRPVQVSERQNNEGPVDYANKAAIIVSRDHDVVAPDCKITMISELYLPHHGGVVGAKP